MTTQHTRRTPLAARVHRSGTGWGTRQNGAEVSLTAAAPALEAAAVPLALPAARSGNDTVEIPLVKLLDPDTENTLELAWPAR
ncbi:hypothetical protein [Streptomyces sp. enrichment culture]|uniref:hypothetical protein n=1 Tax=Streptomyces sp. enrichment culture TaxID=1795815 RepID=UPI003F55FC82